MTNNNKAKKSLFWLLMAVVVVCTVLYYFLNFISSGTHGAIAEYQLNKSKDTIQSKIDSLVSSTNYLSFEENDYTDYVDVLSDSQNIVFTYRIREVDVNSCLLMLVYVKDSFDKKHKTYRELSTHEITNYKNIFQELIITPTKSQN